MIEIASILFCKAQEQVLTPKGYLGHNRSWCVINSAAHLYKEPQLVTSTIGSLCKDEIIEVIGSRGKYFQVKTSSQIGFIEKKTASIFASETPQQTLITTSSKACIVYLKGSCSSGKSSLAKQYVQNPAWVTIDDDVICMKEYVDTWRVSHPEEMKLISEAIDEKNIYMAIKRNLFCFKNSSPKTVVKNAKIAIRAIQTSYKSSTDTWKNIPHQRIRAVVQKQVKEAIENNKNVLLDSWFYTAEQIEKLFPYTRVVKMMLFNPLYLCLQRLEKRNSSSDIEADFREKRFKANVLRSFFNLYKLSDSSYGSICSVDKETVLPFHKAIAQQLPCGYMRESSLTEIEISREEFSTLVESFMEPFNNTDSHRLYIVPKVPQDCIISSANHTPTQLAAFVNQFVSSLQRVS